MSCPVELIAEIAHGVHTNRTRSRIWWLHPHGKQFGKAARLGPLDLIEGARPVILIWSPPQNQCYQILVDGEFVFEERNLGVFLNEFAAKLFEDRTRRRIRCARAFEIQQALLRLPLGKIGMAGDCRRFQGLESLDRGATIPLGDCEFTRAEGQARKQYFTHGCPAVSTVRYKHIQRSLAQFSRALIIAIVKQNYRPVQIKYRRPKLVPFVDEQLAGRCEHLEGACTVTQLVCRQSDKRRSLGNLVPHFQLPESCPRTLRKSRPIPAHVQFEVHLGLIEIAQRPVVRVAGLNAQFASDFVGRDGASVFATEVIQIRYVVLDLSQKERGMLPCAKIAGFAVGFERLGKLIQADVGDAEVAEDDGGIEHLSLFFEYGISTLIKRDGFLKTVLAVKDVSDVRVKAGQAEQVAMSFKDRSCFLAPFVCEIIFSKIDQALQCGGHRACELQFPVERGVDRDRRLVLLAGQLVFVLKVVDMSKRAQAQSAGRLIPKLTAQPPRCLGKAVGAAEVNAHQADDFVEQLLNGFRSLQLWIAAQERTAGALVRYPGENLSPGHIFRRDRRD